MRIEFDLHRKQGLAFTSKAQELFYGGAAGGGKSHLLRIAAIAFCYDIPGLQVYLFRRIFPDLWANHLTGPTSFFVLLADWIKEKLVKVNISKGMIEFWNGAAIHLCHCQYEKDVYKYQGAEIHLLLIDELTHFLKTMYAFLRSRVRLGGLKIPEKYKGIFPRIISSGNPGGIGHNWVKRDFIDFASPFEIKQSPADEGGMLKQFIPAVLEDNPTLTETDPEYENRLEGLGNKALVRAMRYGDWDIVAGGMFDDVWNRDIHIISPFEIPSTWRIDRSFDWGSSRPYSVGWWSESDGCDIVLRDGTHKSTRRGDLFRVAEMYGCNGKPNEGTRELAVEVARKIINFEKAFGRNIEAGPADSSIFDVENGKSIADDMGRLGVHWLRADKSPGSRKNGWEIMRERFKNSITKEGPGLYVFASCRDFIRTVPVLSRDNNKPDDVDSDCEDHVGDECRYRMASKVYRFKSS
jgi:hypothetical protein